jgi:hypothetical protein
VKALDGVDLAMPQRVLHLVVGFGEHQRQIRFSQDGRAENLGSARDALARHRHDVVLDDVEQAGDQGGGGGELRGHEKL